jgi:hypothetical protein
MDVYLVGWLGDIADLVAPDVVLCAVHVSCWTKCPHVGHYFHFIRRLFHDSWPPGYPALQGGCENSSFFCYKGRLTLLAGHTHQPDESDCGGLQHCCH